jgi:hypothetical protein
MKVKIIILSILFLLINCKRREFEQFDFTYGNTFETNFSIKFSADNDSVFIREHWSANNGKEPFSNTNYTSRLSEPQKKKLDSFINNIHFKAFDTLYFENYQDGEYYSFHIKNKDLNKTIWIHSNDAPHSLDDFSKWIYEAKKSLKLIRTAKSFNFKSKAPELELPKAH